MTSAAAPDPQDASDVRGRMPAVAGEDEKPPSEARPPEPPRKVDAGALEELDRVLEKAPALIAEARREVARLRRMELAFREKLLRRGPSAEGEPGLWYEAQGMARRRWDAEERVERLEAAFLAAAVSGTPHGENRFEPAHVLMLLLMLLLSGLTGLGLFIAGRLLRDSGHSASGL